MPARLRALAATTYTILTTTCGRCGLRYDAGDPADAAYHTQPGGCR